jgi:hypothetical protein
MKAALFRCPRSGELVRHFIADQPKPGDQHRYDAVRCNACSLPHMINRATGKVLGQKD